MARYRSSIALAGGGLLISALLIIRGPKLGDHGAGPVRAVAADLDMRQRELAAAVEARAQTLAQLPRLTWAVATDEETVRDLTPDELGFRAQPGEMIAVAQIDKASGRVVTLLRVPAGRELQTPMATSGHHLLVSGGDLLVASVVAIDPRERADAVRGALLVARRLDVEQASAQLLRAGVSARLLAPSGVVTLTVIPALARQPDTEIAIGAAGGLRLAARLPGPRTGLWIAFAIFVLLIWSAAAVMAARRSDALAAGLPLPGMTLPLPANLPSDTTPVLDLITHERNITASSNGHHHYGNGVSAIVDIVSGPLSVGIPHGEALPASTADLQALFREFNDLRRRCGDRSPPPTYDQFVHSLQQRRNEMLESHAAHEVSFQIVFVDGRAVVRAKAVN